MISAHSRRIKVFSVAVTASLLTGLLVAAPAYAAAPTITSFTPTSGKLSTLVTVTGTGFTSPATGKVDGIAVYAVTVQSSTKATLTIPAGAATGKISITTAGGTATSSGSVTVTPGVLLGTVLGPPTTPTTVRFSGLSAFEAADVYVDTAEVALVSTDANGAGSTTVSYPTTALPGVHWVTVVGRHSGSSAQASFTVRTDSTQASFDATKTGANPYENVLSPTRVAKLKQLWSVNIGASMQSTPAVVAGVVYATFGDGSVRAFTATTGAQRWSYQTAGGGTMFSSPTVLGGVLYVGSGNHSVYALTASTGALKWSAATGDIVYSSPTVVGTTVYVGSYDKKLYAFNSTTGAVRWSFPTGAAVFSTPSVSGNVVYFGSFDNSVYALNATTGALVWQTATTGLVLSAPAVVDGLVYAGSEDKILYAFSAATGQIQWTYTLSGVVDSAPAVDDGLVFEADTSGRIYAIDAGSGAFVWAYTNATAVPFRGPLVVADGVVYGTASVTYALRATDGARLRTLPAGGAYGSPAVADGTVTVGNNTAQTLVRYAIPASAGAATPARPSPGALHATW